MRWLVLNCKGLLIELQFMMTFQGFTGGVYQQEPITWVMAPDINYISITLSFLVETV